MKSPRIRRALAGLMLTLAPVAFADGIEWPADFWNQVSNRVSAPPPVPVPAQTPAAFSSLALCVAPQTIGTSEAPFDTRAQVEAWVEACFRDACAVFSIILR